MRLVHDDEVPVAAQQAFVGVLDARDPGDGGDDLVLLLPGVRAVVGAQDVAADDLEVLAELVLHFALPLEGEVGRRDDERALDQAADLQFLEEQAGHDGLAGAGVVGQQEPDAGQLEEVVVDGFELVRQRVDAGDGEREVGVVLVGQRQAQGLDAQAEMQRIAVEGRLLRANLEAGELGGVQDGLIYAARVEALAHQFHRCPQRCAYDDLHGLGEEGASHDGAGFGRGGRHEFGPPSSLVMRSMLIMLPPCPRAPVRKPLRNAPSDLGLPRRRSGTRHFTLVGRWCQPEFTTSIRCRFEVLATESAAAPPRSTVLRAPSPQHAMHVAISPADPAGINPK